MVDKRSSLDDEEGFLDATINGYFRVLVVYLIYSYRGTDISWQVTAKLKTYMEHYN